MVQHALLGIDVGTSGIKVAAFDPRGRMLSRTVGSYASSEPNPGWAEVDSDTVWTATVNGVRSCIDALTAHHPDVEIASVGICGLLATMGMDDHGTPVTPAVLWSDRRATRQMQSLLAAVPRESLVARTGRPPAPERGACIAMWWRDESAESFGRIRWIVSLKDYLLHRLTGAVATDWMNAAYTLLFDVQERAWHADLMQAANLSPDLFPPCLSPAEAGGRIHAAAAAETGLPAGIPVAVGGPDGSMGAVGGGALDETVLVDTAGTTDTVLASVGNSAVDSALGLVVNPHVFPDRWLIGGPTTSTGAVWSWWAQRFSPGGETIDHAELDAVAATVPAGADGLVFLPTFVGDRTPGWNPSARGALVGLDLGHGPAHVARAIIEGTALMVRRCLECIRRAGADPTTVHLVGGAANSALWTQIRADVLGLPVVRLHAPEASAWGAALMGGLASGILPDSAAISPNTEQRAGVCHPNPRMSSLYDDLFETASSLLQDLGDPFDRLADWRERHGDAETELPEHPGRKQQ